MPGAWAASTASWKRCDPKAGSSATATGGATSTTIGGSCANPASALCCAPLQASGARQDKVIHAAVDTRAGVARRNAGPKSRAGYAA